MPFNLLRPWLPHVDTSIDTPLQPLHTTVVDGLRTLGGRFGRSTAGIRFRQVNPHDPDEPNRNVLESWGIREADFIWHYRLGDPGRSVYVDGRLQIRFSPKVRAGFDKMWKSALQYEPDFVLADQPRRTPAELRERILDWGWSSEAAVAAMPLPQGDPREYLAAAETAIESGAISAEVAPLMRAALDAERVQLDLADLEASLRACFPERAEPLLRAFAGESVDGVTLDLARDQAERALAQQHPDSAEDMLARLERAR